MRRARWLAVGAVVGIAGYRRLARAAGSAAGRRPAFPSADARGLGRVAARIPRVRRRLGMRAFLSDVRAGIAEYESQHRGHIDRHPGLSGNTLVGQVAGGKRRIAPPSSSGLRALGAGQGGASARASRSDNAGSDNLKDGR